MMGDRSYDVIEAPPPRRTHLYYYTIQYILLSLAVHFGVYD